MNDLERSTPALAVPLMAGGLIALLLLFLLLWPEPRAIVTSKGISTLRSQKPKIVRTMKVPATPPRGVRNHNPGNIEYGRFAKAHGSIGTDRRFARFKTPVEGIAAMTYLLISYQEVYGKRTPYDMIERWAPHFENNVKSYASRVGKYAGIGVRSKFSMIVNASTAQLVVAGMIRHENGYQPYGTATIHEGYMRGVARWRARLITKGSDEKYLWVNQARK